MNINSKNTKASEITSGVNKISFRSGTVQLAGLLFTPENFDSSKKYPTVVFSGPFNQVKEQMGSNYGREMSSRGYVFLSFDHIGYGDSEGKVRNNEKYEWKAEGIRDAVSYLNILEFVDNERLFGFGGCASGGYMPLVAVTDKRIKAIATVSGMMNNRDSYFSMPKEALIPIFEMANDARQRQYETGVVEYYDALNMEASVNNPELRKGNEGYDYYMTERAGAMKFPNYTHKTVMTLMEDSPMTDATHFAPYLYTPYIGIVGENITVKITFSVVILTVIFFWGHQPTKNGKVTNSCFSQWWMSDFRVDLNTYCCMEQYMMEEKARLFGDKDIEKEIMECKDQKTIKELGRKVRNFDEEIWNNVKYSIVLNGNYNKFIQNDDLREFLISTGDKILVEASPYDKIWGIGISADNEKITNPLSWKGQNLLGFALMEVRDELIRVCENYEKLNVQELHKQFG
jgi:ribA/ribD-fused uncharacterized protein